MPAVNATITSPNELDDLPVGTVVVIGVGQPLEGGEPGDRADMAIQKGDQGEWHIPGIDFTIPSSALRDTSFPALVVYKL